MTIVSLSALFAVPQIKAAFDTACIGLLKNRGYLDMSMYISGRLKKEDLYAALKTQDSAYAALYAGAYPDPDTLVSHWHAALRDKHCPAPDALEAAAIVNWAYRAMRSVKIREHFTKGMLGKTLAGFRLKQGVIYEEKLVDLHFLSSVAEAGTFIASLQESDGTLFYRGHASANYSLSPSIMRSPALYKNENRMYHELQIECPQEFTHCRTHLEKLVKMQHYGLPTRLLDITRNMLVALYFACESQPDTAGELLLLNIQDKQIKYPRSDEVAMLASLPALSDEEQSALVHEADARAFSRLIEEIRLDIPSFSRKLSKSDVMNSYVVLPLKDNPRIVKQDGAFILCGLPDDTASLDVFRHHANGRKTVLLIRQKQKILKELEAYSINRAALFPEIECVSEYLKSKYQKN